MTPKTTDLANLSADQLAAELARREQEAAAEQAERAARLEQARHEWAAETWAGHEATESRLIEQGQLAREAFTAAVKAGDLAGAFAAWMTQRTSRYAREAARSKATSAAQRLGEDAERIPNLRWYSPDFLARLEEEADKQARANGYDLADELVPDEPTEVE